MTSMARAQKPWSDVEKKNGVYDMLFTDMFDKFWDIIYKKFGFMLVNDNDSNHPPNIYIYVYIYVSIYQEQPPATNNQQQEPNHGPSSRTLIPPGSEEGMGQRS